MQKRKKMGVKHKISAFKYHIMSQGSKEQDINS